MMRSPLMTSRPRTSRHWPGSTTARQAAGAEMQRDAIVHGLLDYPAARSRQPNDRDAPCHDLPHDLHQYEIITRAS